MAKSIKQKDINLIAAMTRSDKKPGGSSGRNIVILCIILFVLIVVVVTVLIGMQISSLTAEKEDLRLYVEDPSIVAQYQDSLAAQEKASIMAGQADTLKQVLLAVSSYPYLSSENIISILDYSENRVEIENFNFDRETGIVSFTASSSEPGVIPIFVAQLRLSKIFEDVQYQGYSGGETGSMGFSADPITGEMIETGITRSNYAFAVTCLVVSPEPTVPTAPVVNPVDDSEDSDE